MEDSAFPSTSSPEEASNSDGVARQRPIRGSLFTQNNVFTWRVAGALFAALLVLGWVFIVVILIQEEKWQLVLVAWLLLYAAAHFCYWYFKRHHLLSLHSQICRRVRGDSSGSSSIKPLEKLTTDAPPSYDDVIKSENPPPTYYSITFDTPKSSSPKKFLLSFDSLSNVFGSRSNYFNGSPSTSKTRSTDSNENSPSTSTTKLSCHYRTGSPPPYQETIVDVESQSVIEVSRSVSRSSSAVPSMCSRSSSSIPSRGSRSTLRTEPSLNEGLCPILAPIHCNVNGRSPSPLPHLMEGNSRSAVTPVSDCSDITEQISNSDVRKDSVSHSATT